jgi:hypothetical protein
MKNNFLKVVFSRRKKLNIHAVCLMRRSRLRRSRQLTTSRTRWTMSALKYFLVNAQSHGTFIRKSYHFDWKKHCCGSGSTGSTCFWASWIRIRIHQSEVWIRIQIRLRIWILLSSSKKVRKTLIPTAFWLFIFENDVHVHTSRSK